MYSHGTHQVYTPTYTLILPLLLLAFSFDSPFSDFCGLVHVLLHRYGVWGSVNLDDAPLEPGQPSQDAILVKALLKAGCSAYESEANLVAELTGGIPLGVLTLIPQEEELDTLVRIGLELAKRNCMMWTRDHYLVVAASTQDRGVSLSRRK